MTVTPTPGDLSARLPELPFPDHVDAFGDNSYTADQMRAYAIAALSALPAGGEPVEDLANRVEGIAAWMGHRFGTGCVEADHASLLWQIAKDMRRSLTTPPADADVGAVTEWRWVDERGRAMTNWKQGDPPPMTAVSDTRGTMCVEVRTTPQPSAAEGVIAAAEAYASNYNDDDRQDIKADVMNAFFAGSQYKDTDVGAQGEGSVPDSALWQAIREASDPADLLPRIIALLQSPREPAAPAAGKGVDDTAALAEFTEYFVKNYPGPHTIISDPNWHAPRIFRAAKRALSALTRQPVAGDGWTARWQIEGDDSLLLLSHPVIGGVGVWKKPREGRPMLEEMLYAFGKHLIDTTGPAQGDGGVAS